MRLWISLTAIILAFAIAAALNLREDPLAEQSSDRFPEDILELPATTDVPPLRQKSAAAPAPRPKQKITTEQTPYIAAMQRTPTLDDDFYGEPFGPNAGAMQAKLANEIDAIPGVIDALVECRTNRCRVRVYGGQLADILRPGMAPDRREPDGSWVIQYDRNLAATDD